MAGAIGEQGAYVDAPSICRFGPAIAVDAPADNKGRAAVGGLRSEKVLISRDIAFVCFIPCLLPRYLLSSVQSASHTVQGL